jgi:PAS domain S-box-containing protein
VTTDFSQSHVRESQSSEGPEDTLRLHINLLNAIPAGLIATDVAGQIIYWNRVAAELYGWSAGEVLGRNILEITVPPDNEKEAEEIMSLLRGGAKLDGGIQSQAAGRNVLHGNGDGLSCPRRQRGDDRNHRCEP